MIRIELDGSTTATELNAVAALVAVLGGRLHPIIGQFHGELYKNATGDGSTALHVAEDEPPEIVNLDTRPPSERLIDEAASRAAPPPPSTSAAPPPPPSDGAQEFDVTGMPWDARIHASTRSKNGDKTWRNMRGVDKDLLATVTAELRAAYPAVPAPGNAPPPPPAVEQAAPPPPPTDTAAAATEPPAPAATVASEPTGERMPIEGGVWSAKDFPAVVALSNAHSDTFTYETLNAIAVGLGLEKFASLNKQPHMIPLFYEQMDDLIAAKG